jgi:methylated-DNA-protein-cysteine methyltransferase-like protein
VTLACSPRRPGRLARARGAAPGSARPASSSSYTRIWAVIRRIPRGRVASYGQVADVAGLPRQARLVGYALHASIPDSLPWHRVVNVVGRLSLARRDPAGGLTQRMRLEREGVRFDARGRVRMVSHRWKPRTSRRRT